MANKLFKNPYFYLGAGLVVGGVVTAIVVTENNKKKKQVERLLSIINNAEGQTGTLQDFNFSGSAFDRSYWKSQPCGVVFNSNRSAIVNKGRISFNSIKEVQDLAKSIYDAKGNWFQVDNEGRVLGLFRGLNNKCDVSAISDAFYQKYNLDLLKYLEFVDKKDNYEVLNQIVRQLPS